MVQEIPLHSMEPRPTKGPREDARANRARILEAAQRLFQERGVAQVTMAEVAQAAGVGKGTLYRHFEHKGALCRALLDAHFRGHQDRVLARLRAMAQEGTPVLERLRFFLQESVTFIHEHVALLCEVQRAYGISPAEDAPMMQWLRLTLAGLLRTGTRTGEIDPDLDVALTADLLRAPLTAVYIRHLYDRSGYELDAIVRGILRLVEGLQPGKRGDQRPFSAH